MTVAMLLSGGVDSSVALSLLRQAGHDVTAFYLKIWLEEELAFLGDCPWEEDLAYARSVCQQFDVPLEVVPLQRQYWQQVVTAAIDELRAGRTPSPDIWCNQRIKFGEFFRVAGSGYDKVATGHYARVDMAGDHYQLRCAPDPVKDQTYFLSSLNQEQLARVIFPIGHLTKRDVRQLASNLELPTRDRKDSQGICFLGKISYRDFVRHHLGEQPGAIIERETGTRWGTHQGYWFHTIGQRQGLGLHGGPWYVVGKDVAANIIYVSHQQHRDERDRERFTTAPAHWIGDTPSLPTTLEVKLRHGPHRTRATVCNATESGLDVVLTKPDPGVAPGQSAIFYDDDICLGGAVIVV